MHTSYLLCVRRNNLDIYFRRITRAQPMKIYKKSQEEQWKYLKTFKDFGDRRVKFKELININI